MLVVFAHPVETSFAAALHGRVVDTLTASGHDIDDLDLYAEGFDPVLGRDERLAYHDLERNRTAVRAYVERLQAADALVLCFPTWCFGPPAILKGFLDRTMLPGVAFDLSDPARVRPMLGHIRRVAAVVTYGRPRRVAWWMGDPPRKLVTRYLRWFVARRAPVDYLALYDMNTADDARRTAFLARVERHFAWFG